jgi:2'-5' RNA ligase
LHITVEFLGDLTDEELADVCLITKEVAQRHEIFSLNINEISYGPKNKMPPRMIWASGEKSKELSALKNDLEKSLLEKVRFAPAAPQDGASLAQKGREERSFVPHVTLARINSFAFRQIDPEEVPQVQENTELVFTVESIEVMESELKRGGPVYTVLDSCELKS